jgi:hypothetical protein
MAGARILIVDDEEGVDSSEYAHHLALRQVQVIALDEVVHDARSVSLARSAERAFDRIGTVLRAEATHSRLKPAALRKADRLPARPTLQSGFHLMYELRGPEKSRIQSLFCPTGLPAVVSRLYGSLTTFILPTGKVEPPR